MSFNYNLTSLPKYFEIKIKHSGITDFNLQRERVSSLASPFEGPLVAALWFTHVFTLWVSPHVDSRVDNFHRQQAQSEVLVGNLKEIDLLEGFSVVDIGML